MKRILKKILPQSIINFFNNFKNGNYMFWLWIFPVKKNRIVIVNYYGKGYGDNPKYLAEKLLEQDVEIIWLINKDTDPSQFHSKIRLSRYGSWKSLYYLSTAKVWIDNCRKDFYPPKRRNQIYIHTGHGGVPLKKVEFDVEDKLSSAYINKALRDSKMADYMFSNSDIKTNILRRAYKFDGCILDYGIPKIDPILDDRHVQIKRIVKDYYDLEDKSKILLYAPTFRNNKSDIPKLDIENTLNLFEKKFGGNWICLIRMHPNVETHKSHIDTENIKNATDYPDMQELMISSDAMITDYSGTIFEYFHLRKPLYLYIPDYEDYLKERDVYFDLKEWFVPYFEKNEELEHLVFNSDFDQYLQDVEGFLKSNNFNLTPKASSKISEKIMEVIRRDGIEEI